MAGAAVISLAATLALALGGATRADTSSAATPSAPAHRSRCLPHGARTLAADRYARVLELGPQPPAGPFAPSARIYACLLSRGRLVPLDRGRGRRVADITLRGRLLAYSLYTFGIDYRDSQVLERDLATGRVLELPAAEGTGLPESFSGVLTLLLAPGGALAWISSSTSIARPGPAVQMREVHYALPSGASALLESSSAIVASSLALSGRTLAWRDGAQLRSATLPLSA